MSEQIGEKFDDARKAKYLAWLLTPKSERVPATQAGIAELCGVSPRTLRDWNNNEEFRKVWKAEAAKLIATPEQVQEVLDALRAKALDPTARDQVPAAKEWLNRVGADALGTPEANGSKPLSSLSLEELQAIAALKAQNELRDRDAKLRLVEGG